MPLIARTAARCERGFTTVTLMGVLAVGTLLVAGGFAAVTPDITISRDDQDYKQAYAAAEAGLQWYLSSLGTDNDYYVDCTDVPDPSPSEPAPVNQAWDGTGADPRVWRALPASDSEYTVELLPAPGYPACVEDDQYSMVDPDGNMKVRVSGRSREQTRTLLATLRRRNFIDFIYFTHFETLDPLAYSSSNKRSWASTNCNQFRTERDEENYPFDDSDCLNIQFPTGDSVLGPLHTNDSIMVCGSPTFGRDSRDSIELNEQSPGYVSPGCSDDPNFVGTLTYPSGQLELPPSNAEIAALVDDDYHFHGRTRIELDGATMTVDRTTLPDVTLPLPPNGVVYVQGSGTCSVGYAYNQTYSSPSGCGDVYVKGEYSGDLTIAADNDVVVDGSVTRTSDGLLLGLIANNFVRVYHPVTGSSSCANATGSLTNPEIHAAILALNHSFIVDNWHCGANLGTLTVDGAIAQRYRGPVGLVGGAGYLKNYVYNDRLKYREPPYFLDPVQASWRVARQTEQVPAVGQ